MKGTVTNISLPVGGQYAAVNVQLQAEEGAPVSTLSLNVPQAELGNYQLGQEYDINFTPTKAAAPVEAAQ